MVQKKFVATSTRGRSGIHNGLIDEIWPLKRVRRLCFRDAETEKHEKSTVDIPLAVFGTSCFLLPVGGGCVSVSGCLMPRASRCHDKSEAGGENGSLGDCNVKDRLGCGN